MSSSRFFNPVYVARRLYLLVYERLHPNDPWIAAGAVKFCAEHLTKNMVALEWGSGRSTLWWARHVGRLVSVEHNKQWHVEISRRIAHQGLSNIDYRFVELDHPESEGCVARYETEPRYVAVANEFEDESLDFVVVDGHYRQTCVLAALPKLRRGGYLLLDNVNWLPLENWGVPPDWNVAVDSSNAITQTMIWSKP